VPSPFSEITDLSRSSEPGRYEGVVSEDWTIRPFPQGGALALATASAMSLELDDPTQRLRMLHTTFVAPVEVGPIEVDVEVVRRGRSMSHVRGEVRNPGSAHGSLTTAVFGASRRGFEFTDLEPPVGFIPLAEAPSFRDPKPPEDEGFPTQFWERVLEGRAAIGHASWDEYTPDRAETGTWYRLDEPPMCEDGTQDLLSLLVYADTMPGAVGEKLGPTERTGWFGPSVDFACHLFSAPSSEWVFGHNRARFAGDGYGSIDMAVWDFGADGTGPGRLLAYATQLCFFAFGA
jgi:acyl-CoA thioesterase